MRVNRMEYRKLEEQMYRVLRGMGVDIDNIYTADRVSLDGILEKTFHHGATFDNTKITLSESSIKLIETIRDSDPSLKELPWDAACDMIIENSLFEIADKIENRKAWEEYERKVKKEWKEEK